MSRVTLRHRERLDRWARQVPAQSRGDELGAMLAGVVTGCAAIVVAIVVFA